MVMPFFAAPGARRSHRAARQPLAQHTSFSRLVIVRARSSRTALGVIDHLIGADVRNRLRRIKWPKS
jgi:hypothetical protein